MMFFSLFLITLVKFPLFTVTNAIPIRSEYNENKKQTLESNIYVEEPMVAIEKVSGNAQAKDIIKDDDNRLEDLLEKGDISNGGVKQKDGDIKETSEEIELTSQKEEKGEKRDEFERGIMDDVYKQLSIPLKEADSVERGERRNTKGKADGKTKAKPEHAIGPNNEDSKKQSNNENSKKQSNKTKNQDEREKDIADRSEFILRKDKAKRGHAASGRTHPKISRIDAALSKRQEGLGTGWWNCGCCQGGGCDTHVPACGCQTGGCETHVPVSGCHTGGCDTHVPDCGTHTVSLAGGNKDCSHQHNNHAHECVSHQGCEGCHEHGCCHHAHDNEAREHSHKEHGYEMYEEWGEHQGEEGGHHGHHECCHEHGHEHEHEHEQGEHHGEELHQHHGEESHDQQNCCNHVCSHCIG